MPSVTASAPGKVILLGEHAAVYGRPALVTGAGLRLRATIETVETIETENDGVHLRVPSSGYEETTTWREVLATARAARAAWEGYAAAPSAAAFREVAKIGRDARDGADAPGAGSSAGRLLRIALGEAADSLDRGAAADAGELEPIVLTVRSEIPVGSGFGSSAAAAVAVILAYLASRGASPSPDDLQRLSLEVERRQHGTPSGVDNATVIHGGVLEARRTDGGTVELRPVPVQPDRLRHFRIVGSGPPAEGTGTVVAAVRDLRERDPAAVDARFDRLAALTATLRDALCRNEERPETIVDTVREAHRCLVALGVVPPPVVALIEQVEARGGAAKISGAGSLAGPGAGNVLLYHPHPGELDRLLTEWTERAADAAPGGGRPLHVYDVDLGADGARLEQETP